MSSKTTVQVLANHIDELDKLREEYAEKSKLLMDQYEEFGCLIAALKVQLDLELSYNSKTKTKAKAMAMAKAKPSS
jgi:hypothetical protein